MARLKISQLQETTTPSSSDILPIVSGGTTKKVTLETIYNGFNGGSDVSSLSANWQNTFNTVQSNSAVNWNYQGTDLKSLSANWENTYTSYRNASGSFATNTTVSNISSQLVLNSDFNSYKTEVATATGTLVETTNFNTYKTNVAEATATLTPLTTTRTLTGLLVTSSDFGTYKTEVASATSTLLPYTTYQNTSGNWQNTFNTVLANSATSWDNSLANQYTHTNFLPLSGGTIQNNLTVLSALHVGQGVIDFVVTEQGNVGINTESPNQKLTVIGNISATGLIQTAVSVVTSSSTYTFDNSDSNRVYHFETVSPLSAIFPGSLAQGFNVTIMNTGTGTLYLSAPSYKALSNVLLDQYSGAFVYKQGSDIFAVGGL